MSRATIKVNSISAPSLIIDSACAWPDNARDLIDHSHMQTTHKNEDCERRRKGHLVVIRMPLDAYCRREDLLAETYSVIGTCSS